MAAAQAPRAPKASCCRGILLYFSVIVGDALPLEAALQGSRLLAQWDSGSRPRWTRSGAGSSYQSRPAICCWLGLWAPDQSLARIRGGAGR
jgi:hypothetical protein